MDAIRFELEGRHQPSPQVPTSSPQAVRDLALLCRSSGLPFRLRYPLNRPFRYPMAASFTSR